MQINIREAVQKDCSSILKLIKQLAEYERAKDEVVIDVNYLQETGFGTSPIWWALVAEIEDKIVGIAIYYTRFSTWKGARMYLEDIIVEEDYRGKGIGKLLMNNLIEVAKQKNFSGMMWQVLDWNEPAINFYKKYNASFDNGWVNVSIESNRFT